MAASRQDALLATVGQQILTLGDMIGELYRTTLFSVNLVTIDVDIQEKGEHRGGSSSVSKLMATVVPLLIVSIPMVLTFFCLRQKQHRLYAPRTFLDVLKDE